MEVSQVLKESSTSSTSTTSTTLLTSTQPTSRGETEISRKSKTLEIDPAIGNSRESLPCIILDMNQDGELRQQLPRSYRFLIEKYAGDYRKIEKGLPQKTEITDADKNLAQMCRDYKTAYDNYKTAGKSVKKDPKNQGLVNALKQSEKKLLDIQVKFLRRRLGVDKILILNKMVENEVGLYFNHIQNIFKEDIIKIENMIFTSPDQKQESTFSNTTAPSKMFGFYVSSEEVEREVRVMERLLALFEREARIQQIILNHYNKDYQRDIKGMWPSDVFRWYNDAPRNDVEQAIKNAVNEQFLFGPYRLHLISQSAVPDFSSIKARELWLYVKKGDLYFKLENIDEKKIEKRSHTSTFGLSSVVYDSFVKALEPVLPQLSPQDEWFLLNFAALSGYLLDDLSVQATLRVIGKQRAMFDDLQGRVKGSKKANVFKAISGHHIRFLGESPDEQSLARLKLGEIGVFIERNKLKLMHELPRENSLGPGVIGIFREGDLLYCKADSKQRIRIVKPGASVIIDITEPPFANEKNYTNILNSLKSNSSIVLNSISLADQEEILTYLSLRGYADDSLYCKVQNKERVELFQHGNFETKFKCGLDSFKHMLITLKNPRINTGLLRVVCQQNSKKAKFSTSTNDRMIEGLEELHIDKLVTCLISSEYITASNTAGDSYGVTQDDIDVLEASYKQLHPIEGEVEEIEIVKSVDGNDVKKVKMVKKSFSQRWENPNHIKSFILYNKKPAIDSITGKLVIDTRTGKRKYVDEEEKDIAYRFQPYTTLYPHRKRMLGVLQELVQIKKPIIETKEKQETNNQYNIQNLERHRLLYAKLDLLLNIHIGAQRSFDSKKGMCSTIESAFSIYMSPTYVEDGLSEELNLCGRLPIHRFSTAPLQVLTDDSFYEVSDQQENMVDRKEKYKLDSFTKIDLSKNMIHGNIPSLSNGLIELNVSSNRLKSVKHIINSKKLKFLDASSNLIDNLEGLDLCGSLIYLKLKDNNLNTHLSINLISRLEYLTYLNIANCGIINIEFLTTLTALRELDISENSIPSLQPIAPLSALISLKANNNFLEGTFIKWFAKDGESLRLTLSQLRYCDLSSNKGLSFCPINDSDLDINGYRKFLPSLEYIKITISNKNSEFKYGRVM